MTKFATAAEVRKFLKGHGYTKIKVRWSNNPFGGEGKFFVALTDIPSGTTMIHSSGSQTPATTYTDNADVSRRIAQLREIVKGTNVGVDH